MGRSQNQAKEKLQEDTWYGPIYKETKLSHVLFRNTDREQGVKAAGLQSLHSFPRSDASRQRKKAMTPLIFRKYANI